MATRSQSAMRERPYSEARPLSSHGAPSDGKSVGMMPPKVPIWRFIAAVPCLIALSRCSGSAICVPRSITVPVTWLFMLVSPSARSEIGTPATSDASGSSLPSLR